MCARSRRSVGVYQCIFANILLTCNMIALGGSFDAGVDVGVGIDLVLLCLCSYRGDDKSLARPTSRCILFDGENILFDASLAIYIYINSSNVPPIMIINRIYETQNLLSL